MAITVDGPNSLITVTQTDTDILTLDSGTLYIMDTQAFRNELKAWEESELGMVWPDTHTHATTVTISGTTFARSIVIIPPYQIVFSPDSQWTVLMDGASNNNYHDVGAGILVQNQVQVIPQNSAGNTVTQTGVSGLTSQEALDLAEVRRARKILTNRQELVNTGSDIRLRTWDDDGTTILEENVVTDPDNNDPDLSPRTVTKRGVSQ